MSKRSDRHDFRDADSARLDKGSEDYAEDVQHRDVPRNTRMSRNRLRIYDAHTMEPAREPTSQDQRGPLRPTHDELHLTSTPHPSSRMGIFTQQCSPRSSANSRDKGSEPQKGNFRHLSAQRNSQGKARERFRSAGRAENTFKNRTTQQIQNKNHLEHGRQQRDGNHGRNVHFLSGKDSRKQEIVMPTPESVFNFMVKNMAGKGTPEDIRYKSKLFPKEFDIMDWFRKNKSWFTLIERNGDITYIFVYNKKATYCIKYGMKRPCTSPDCQRYHLCRYLCSGKCLFGRRCDYSHDCFDEHNGNISDNLGFRGNFANDEICSILRVSFPRVCSTWSHKDTCREPNCAELHLCREFILGKCRNGPTCRNIHDRNTDHNRAILEAFEMTEMENGKFKWRVFMDGARFRSLLSETADDAGEKFICVDHIIKECRERHCKSIHTETRMPYVWQIKIFNEWVSLNESEKIEETFADNADSSAKIQTTYNEMALFITIFFEPVIKAKVIIQDLGDDVEETEARRLSTVSYIESMSVLSDGEEINKDKFVTQWRWYWMDDYNLYHLFEPEAFQWTLETKYLAKQPKYLFSRDVFRYEISFFDRMYQNNLVTHNSRRIMRRPVFVSSEAVSRRECLPSLNNVNLITTPVPKSWMPWDLCSPFELVDIVKDHPSEVDHLMDLFFETIDQTTKEIRRIYRVQNHKLWGLFRSEEITLQAKARRFGYPETGVNRRLLFHGTDDMHAVDGICVNNVDIRMSGKTGSRYGQGAYFARDAKYSHCYTKGLVRYMFVVDVLVGQFTKGDPSYRRPPELPGSRELYDSCVDDVSDPSIFVLFDKNQYYPQYLIEYRDM